MRIFKKHLKEVTGEIQTCSDNCKHNSATCSRLEKINRKHLNNAVKEYRNFYNYSNDYTEDDKETLEVFMVKFQKYHAPAIAGMRNTIQRLSDSNFKSTCFATQSAILNAYRSSFDLTMVDVEDTITHLNGELTGKTIRGIEIGNIVEQIG